MGDKEEKMLERKTLLVTGGTGSFGNAVVKRFIGTGVKEIRIFSRDEKKQHDMRLEYKSEKLKFYIGDVRFYESINSAMRGVDYVFSAAALKQVPSCEFYPIEAVRTNVLGTDNTLRAAVENKVGKVVVLSTDKAVYPINAMGMSKALMEKVTIANSRNVSDDGPLMCNTRYGNVMGSRGSVIPLFISQILNHAPITVTDPEMTRFMMSLPQAVELVLYAFAHAQSGDTFVQKAPAATIETLVEALQSIFHSNCEVKIMGTRHGEKKAETLLSREEMIRAIDLGDYYRVPADTRDLNYSQYFDQGNEVLSSETEYNSDNTKRLTVAQMRELLLELDFVQKSLREARNA